MRSTGGGGGGSARPKSTLNPYCSTSNNSSSLSSPNHLHGNIHDSLGSPGHSNVTHKDMASVFLQQGKQSLSLDEITANLRDRLHSSSSYTRIGGRIIVSVNPSKSHQQHIQESDALSKSHAYRSKSSWTYNSMDQQDIAYSDLPDVHLFDLVDAAYMHMTRGSEDQSIILE